MEDVQDLQDALKMMAANMQPEDIEQLLVNYGQQTTDLKAIKDMIYVLLIKFGILNDDGSLRENISIKKITGALMPMLIGGEEKIKKELGFITEIAPLIMKYKDL
jgi:hypothetical protein